MDNGASSYRRFRDDGDENGLIDIITQYRDGLIFYINSFTSNIQLAEEIAEDVFVLLATKKPKDKGGSSFKTWLYTIARNLTINRLKQMARRKEISYDLCAELTDDEAQLERTYIREDQKIALHRAIQNLKPEYRQIIWLTYFEGFSNKEASLIMKKSVHNIETLLYRARKSLKQQLEKENFYYEEY